MGELIARVKALGEDNCRAVIDDDPEVEVTTVGGAEHLLFEVDGDKEDVGLLIGTQGGNIIALRTRVLSACGAPAVRTQVDVCTSRREQAVSEISRDLKILAKELNVPVLALSQLSRAVEHRAPPIPQLSDLRDSGAIEQDADVILFLYRGDLARRRDGEAPDAAQLILAKQRNGPVGVVPLRFDAQAVRFDSLALSYHQQLVS
jgi:predicted RNA-binding protein YlqC (UPF0109 family)